MAGFIALHRQIESHWIFEDPDYFRIWVAMLFAANFKDGEALMNGRVVRIKRGQLVFGLNAWSARYRVTSRKLRTLIKHLENSKMIDRQTTNKYSIISITNYESHQGSDKPVTIKRHSDDKPATTLEQGKQVNNGNNNTIVPDGINISAWSEWEQYRKSAKKKITPAAAKKQFKLLLQYSEQDQQAIIDKSISNDYQGLFDLNGASSNGSHQQGAADNSTVGRASAAAERYIRDLDRDNGGQQGSQTFDGEVLG